jgi:acyl-[acyl-carrier-protein]-phospholipid O-acyltransferase/long-chain-fatty-acid--[acyl-carrier-protein] ligase
MSEPKPLLLSRRFAPLFWCQFFSAFTDNFLRTALVFLILFKMEGSAAESLITLVVAVFIAPYFFLSAFGGEIADHYDKAIVTQWLKLAAIGVALIGIAAFIMHSVPILFVALFGFGVIGALFGPIKYGILPDLLQRSELPAANAFVEGATFIAILLGTIVGGLTTKAGGDAISFAGIMLGFSILSWALALLIPRVGSGAPDLRISANVVSSTARLLKDLRGERRLWWGALVTSWYWLVGAVVMSLLPPLVKSALGGTEELVTTFLAVFSVAVAAGSALAAWLAAGRIVILPTLIGAMLFGIFAADLGWATLGTPSAQLPLGVEAAILSSLGLRMMVDVAGLAIAGGLYIVPTFSAVQAWAAADRRARVIAGVNVLNAAFMAGGAGSVALLQAADISTPVLFISTSVTTFIVAIMIGQTMPAKAAMDFLTIVFRALYRIEVKGMENLLNAGPNPIIALNHVSFLDAAVALSLLPKDPVFAIDSAIAQRWWVRPFLHFTHAIPLDPIKPMAIRTLINAVKAGKPLIIFPEGRLTVTGSLMKVYDGAGLIADKTAAYAVPVRLAGLEYTPFTRLTRAQVRQRWFPTVTVTVLEPVKLTIDPGLKGRHRRQAAGAALYEIMSNLVYRTTSIERTVPEALIEAAEIHGISRVAVEDPVGGALRYRRLLMGTRILGEKLMAFAPEGKPVGVMLPNANGAALTVIALMSAGRVPTMINYTAGSAKILAACKAAKLDMIVTSRAFIARGRLDTVIAAIQSDVKIVYLDDIQLTIGLGDKLRGFWNAKKPLVKRRPDDWAAILFTSGSEGLPKGVVLSHRNMLANSAQAAARIDFGRQDKVFNVLPLFHSFGLTIGLILPLVSGVRVYLYPSPLHYRTVPELIYGVNATILFGTDTFLKGYARAAHAYDFRSLRYILAGAEPVKETTRHIYLEKFGLRILEGYGVTETAPALALNTPMFNKFGTVGRLLPGMEVRLEKVEGVEDGGCLSVKGPNVMLGYLRTENPGVLEPPPGGWHDTGDIVTVDKQGFITIKGRAKRFAKIAGEMVSLAAVEALADVLWPNTVSAVVPVPDVRKGERLIMVTQKKGALRSEFQAFARSRGASELMTPAEVVHLEKIPLLGSGKVDNVAVTKIVRDMTAAKSSAAASA